MTSLVGLSLKRRATDRESASRRMGVVDIGSNSVRLVIYDVTGRNIQARFNEKVLAGLGRGLADTGRLNPEGLTSAMAALFRFKAAMDAQGVDEVIAFATAAVREAEDGAAFCARVREDVGLNIRVLSGADEARYAATGVIAMQPEANGVSGDLGGSSLELSLISDGEYLSGHTYGLGPLALQSVCGEQDRREGRSNGLLPAVSDEVREYIAKEVADAAELRTDHEAFYMVGGAWRALARLYMDMNDYPLRVLQNFEVDAAEMIALADRIASPDKKMSARLVELSRRRAPTLPMAAAVLSEVLRQGGFKTVVTSSFGVREGLVYEALDANAWAQDPLLAGLRAIIHVNPDGEKFGMALVPWLAQAAQATLPARLSEAACMVADIGSYMHPDHRADMSFDWLVTAPLAGMTHKERAALALVVACRYQRNYQHPTASHLLDGETAAQARALGALMRLGAHYSGRSSALLSLATLSVADGCVLLDVRADYKELASDMVRKRLQQAASIMGMEARLLFSGVQVAMEVV